MRILFLLLRFSSHQNECDVHFGWQRHYHPDSYATRTYDDPRYTHFMHRLAEHVQVNTQPNQTQSNGHDDFE